MNRPALIPNDLKALFHNKNCCIDVRDNKPFSLKANTSNRNWHNVVTLEKAAVAINHRTKRANSAVRKSTQPFHVLTFGCGADTYYWGRYRFACVRTFQGQTCFELHYVDDGDLHLCSPKDARQTRSHLESQWLDAFQVSGTEHVYEPATLHLPPSELLPDKQYTPDIWLPDKQEFIEIKGPNPSAEELEKCRLTTELGFKIRLFHGAPDGFVCYDWDKNGKCRSSKHRSWYRYIHPCAVRKKRKLHNVSQNV